MKKITTTFICTLVLVSIAALSGCKKEEKPTAPQQPSGPPPAMPR